MQPFAVITESALHVSHLSPNESFLHWQRPVDCSQSSRDEPNTEHPHATNIMIMAAVHLKYFSLKLHNNCISKTITSIFHKNFQWYEKFEN